MQSRRYRKRPSVRNLLRVVLVAAALLLSYPNEVVGQQPTPPQGPPASVYVAPTSLNGDTLHVSPWIAQTMAQFDSLESPRVFCVTAHHRWPGYTYLKSLRPNELTLRCIGTEPIFVQSFDCPTGPIAPEGGAPLFIIIQCGDEDNIKYYVPANSPNVRRGNVP